MAKKSAKKKTAKKITKKTAKKATKAVAKKPVKKSVKKTAQTSPKTSKVPSSLKIGDKVPDFSLPSTTGEDFVLSHLQGRKVVLYFYPKDSTPGCTIEGHDFSNLQQEFNRKNAVVFGISRDSIKSHCNFRDKQSYKIHLLSDESEKACGIFSVIKEKNMYGKMVLGIERSTFVIDENGVLSHEWRKVQVENHAKEVLNSI